MACVPPCIVAVYDHHKLVLPDNDTNLLRIGTKLDEVSADLGMGMRTWTISSQMPCVYTDEQRSLQSCPERFYRLEPATILYPRRCGNGGSTHQERMAEIARTARIQSDVRHPLLDQPKWSDARLQQMQVHCPGLLSVHLSQFSLSFLGNLITGRGDSVFLRRCRICSVRRYTGRRLGGGVPV
jgi:hypothetical protein